MVNMLKRKGMAVIIAGIILWGGNAWCAKIEPSFPGKESKARIGVSCVLVETTRFFSLNFIKLNCPFTLTYELGDPSFGGHNHHGSRPLGELVRVAGGNGITVGEGSIEGRTNTETVILEYTAPEAAVELQFRVVYGTPVTGNYRCVDCTDEWKLDVGIDGLKPLLDQEPGEHYMKVRGDKDKHPEGYYGTADTIATLKKIAEEYYGLSDRILSINDISLPNGGLFDLGSDWTPSHHEHRTGRDADINRPVTGPGPEDRLKCYDNKDLRDATEEVAGKKSRPYLACENENFKKVPPDDPTGKYYHIDFD